jgi:hypothetical protein
LPNGGIRGGRHSAIVSSGLVDGWTCVGDPRRGGSHAVCVGSLSAGLSGRAVRCVVSAACGGAGGKGLDPDGLSRSPMSSQGSLLQGHRPALDHSTGDAPVRGIGAHIADGLFAAGGLLAGVDDRGRLLWHRTLAEAFGAKVNPNYGWNRQLRDGRYVGSPRTCPLIGRLGHHPDQVSRPGRDGRTRREDRTDPVDPSSIVRLLWTVELRPRPSGRLRRLRGGQA